MLPWGRLRFSWFLWRENQTLGCSVLKVYSSVPCGPVRCCAEHLSGPWPYSLLARTQRDENHLQHEGWGICFHARGGGGWGPCGALLGLCLWDWAPELWALCWGRGEASKWQRRGSCTTWVGKTSRTAEESHRELFWPLKSSASCLGAQSARGRIFGRGWGGDTRRPAQ